METCGVGIDVVEMSRIRAIRFLERFAEIVFTPHECEQLKAHPDPAAFIASRFALKEAVIKSFPETIVSRDFEIRKKGVRPYAHFFNPAHRAYRVHVSLSHSSEYAAGCAVTEKV